MRANSVAADSINREPVEVAVGDLDEDVCPVDDVCEHPALGQSLGHATFQRLVQLPQPRLALAQRCLGRLALTDVDCGAGDPHAAPCLIEHAASFGRYPADDPVLLADGAVLDVVERATCRVSSRGECFARRCAVLRM